MMNASLSFSFGKKRYKEDHCLSDCKWASKNDPASASNIDPPGRGKRVISVLDSPAVIACFNDVAMVCDPVKQGRGHFMVTKDRGTFTKGEIGGNDDRCFLV